MHEGKLKDSIPCYCRIYIFCVIYLIHACYHQSCEIFKIWDLYTSKGGKSDKETRACVLVSLLDLRPPQCKNPISYM